MEKWKFNDLELNTDNWGVTGILEGSGTPALRGSDTQVPFADGLRHEKKRHDSRPFILGMFVQGDTERELYDNVDKLSRVFGRLGQYPLERTLNNGETRTAMAEVVDTVSFPRDAYGLSKFVVEFQLADPFFYATNEVVDIQDITDEVFLWQHVQNGTAHVTNMQIKFSGPMESPTLKNLDNNIWLEFQGNISAGESIIVDTEFFTCFKGEQNLMPFVKHGGDANWLILEAGTNNLELSNGAVGGSVEVTYRPAYF